MDRSPDFVVIGAQKSASTFLQGCLTAHPDVWMPEGETPHFESPDYERASEDFFGRLFDGRDEASVGIKRPNYIGRPEVPPRIAADLPEARLVAVLRDPVARAVSAWFHLMKSGFLPVVPIEEGMPQLLDDPGFVKRHPRAAELLEFGLYDKHLSGYDGFAERSQLLVMLHEDVLADPLSRVQAVYRHLGVDDGFHPGPALTARPQAVVYTPARLRLLRLRPRLLYHFSKNGDRMTGRRRNPLRKAAAAGIVGADGVLLARAFGNAKPKLSLGLRGRLHDFYRADVRRLEERLGRDLSAWVPR